MNRKFGKVLVATGTFFIPASQWLVFWLITRADGAESAGVFALLLAISTPVFTLTNFGLRNSFITLIERHPFKEYFVLRLVGCTVGSLFLIGFGIATNIGLTLVLLVTAQKAADAVLDIAQARFQRSRQFTIFGLTMISNGAATVCLAVVFAIGFGTSTAIIAASAIGSILSLVFAMSIMRKRQYDSNEVRDVGTEQPSAASSKLSILRESAPIATGQIFSILVVSIPTWIVGFGTEDSDVARFAGAAYILTLGSLVGSLLNSIYIAEYQVLISTGATSELRRQVARPVALTVSAGVIASGFAYFLGGPVLDSIYGADFSLDPLPLAIITIAAGLNPGTHILNASLLATNAYGAQLRVVAWATACTAVFLILAPISPEHCILFASLSALSGSLIKLILSLSAFRNSLRDLT